MIDRLTVTTGPFVANAAPATVSGAAYVQVFGWNLSADQRLPVQRLGGDAMRELREFEPASDRLPPGTRLGFVYAPGFGGSSRVRIVDYPVHTTLANTDPHAPPVLHPTTSVTARLGRVNQVDKYDVALSKGQAIVIAADSECLGSPAVPVMRLLKPDQSLAAETGDPGTNKETQLRYTAQTDGLYRLQIQDRYLDGSSRHFYRLAVFGQQPRFALPMDYRPASGERLRRRRRTFSHR